MTEQTTQPKQSTPKPAATTPAAPDMDAAAPEENFAPRRRMSDILHLQRTVGNRQTRRLISRQVMPRPVVTRRTSREADETIQRRMKGTASALSFVSEGSGMLLTKDTWKKLVEAVQDYEALEEKQPTGGNRDNMYDGFKKLFAKLQDIRKLADKWMTENDAATAAERTGYAASEYPKIRDNAATEKSNKLTQERNRGLPAAAQAPLDPLVPVAPEGTRSQQMGALKSLMLRVTVEQQQVETALRNPSDNAWLKNSEVFTDSPQNQFTDNAVGGAMNKLDRGNWQQQFSGKQTAGFFIKDKSIDPLTAGTGAGAIGIPKEDPNYAGRSLAMGRIDQIISDKVKEITRYVNSDTRPLLVNMQLATHTRETARGSGRTETKMGVMSEQARGVEFRSGQVEASNVAIDSASKAGNQMSLDDPVLQRGLNKLQLLDAICGQVDRHLANIYVETDATGAVTSVQGIDNDMAFGAQHGDLNDPGMRANLRQFAWRGLPPIADYDVAMAIRNITERELAAALTGLIAPAELDATINRFKQVRTFLVALPDTALIRHDQWVAQKTQLAAQQTGANSYLGTARNETVEQWFKQNSPALVASMTTIITTNANVAPGSAIPDQGANLIVGKLKPLVADGRIQLGQTRTTGDTLAQDVAGRLAADPNRDALVYNEVRDLIHTAAQARGWA